MSRKAKNAVIAFCGSQIFDDLEQLQELLHDDLEIYWNSSKGFLKLNKGDITELMTNFKKNFHAIRSEISHVFSKDEQVVIRYTYHVHTLENPEEEVPLAHFITIWEIKDDKLYRGYEMSQMAVEDPISLKSFSDFKFQKTS